MYDFIIIGGGIIGSTVCKSLKKLGLTVLCIDNNRELSGTKPSGGHCRPEWLGGMNKDDYTPALEVLQDVWTVTEEKFSLFGTVTKLSTVYRVDTDEVCRYPKRFANITSITKTDEGFVVKGMDKLGRVVFQGERVLVATGVWADELFPGLFPKKIQMKQGISFRFKHVLKRGFIQPWAPYKQIVAHQQTPELVWIGDGSAILKDNWTAERSFQCQQRCRKALKTINKPEEIRKGLRAYYPSVNKKDPCFFQKVEPGLWVATGAGKLGTISAGWIAFRFNQLLG